MLLGAQFCSDTFSSVSLDSVNEGTTYSLYARQDMSIICLPTFLQFNPILFKLVSYPV